MRTTDRGDGGALAGDRAATGAHGAGGPRPDHERARAGLGDWAFAAAFARGAALAPAAAVARFGPECRDDRDNRDNRDGRDGSGRG